MVEILMEENYLRRYEPIEIRDIAVLPTETDLWLTNSQKRLTKVTNLTNST